MCRALLEVEGGSRRDDTSKFKIMKKETWKLIVQILISILTALGTTLGVTSCM